MLHKKKLITIFSSKNISFAIKLFLTVTILYLVLSSVSKEDFMRAYSLISIKPLLIIFILVSLQILLLANRWYLLATSVGSKISRLKSVYGILISFFFSQGLPASLGGDAFRLWWHKREGIATGSALNIIFMDRIYGLFSLVLLCGISLLIMINQIGGSFKIFSLILFILFTGCSLSIFLMPYRLGFSKRFHQKADSFPKVVGKLLRWIHQLRNTLSSQLLEEVILLMVLGVLTHLLVVIEFFVIGHFIASEQITFLVCLAAVPPALFISYMPFSIAGWGVREASMVVAFGLYGIHSSTAILISLTIGMIVLVISLVGGLIWILGGFRGLHAKTAEI